MMTVADETRRQINTRTQEVQTVGATRSTSTQAPAQPTVTVSEATNPNLRSSSENQSQTTMEQRVNPSDNLQVNASESMKVNPDERLDFLVNKQKNTILTPEEAEELSNLQKNQKKNVGNVKKAENKNESEADLSPIKIEEDDIIKYMMKDIILASAGWAGGKICGLAGYGVYKLASGTYHYFVDKDKEGAKVAGKSTNEGYEKYEINDKDDKTTAFTKRMGYNLVKQHEKIDLAAQINTYNLQTLANAAIDNKLGQPLKLLDPQTGEEKECTSLDDALKTVPMAAPQDTKQMLQNFQQAAQNNPTKLDELKQQAQLSIQTTIDHQAAQKLFEEQYATAMMIQNMQRDPSYLGIQDYKNPTKDEEQKILQEKKLHRNNAKLLLERMDIEYHRNPPTALTHKLHEQYSSFEEFVGISAIALEHAQKNTEKGRYVEKGNNPEEKKNLLRQTKENPNEALDHLNELMGIKKPEQNNNTQQASMLQAAQQMQSIETQDVDRNITALEAELDINDKKRKRVQEVKNKAKGKNPYQKQQSINPTINAFHNAQSHGGTRV